MVSKPYKRANNLSHIWVDSLFMARENNNFYQFNCNTAHFVLHNSLGIMVNFVFSKGITLE